MDQARCSLSTLGALAHVGHSSTADQARKQEIEGFITHAARQIDQVQRRVILGQSIPREEKVFSLFQPHTEWISKGKAPVPVEFGVKVCILEDQYQLILHHQVMEHQSDQQVCVPMVTKPKSEAWLLCATKQGNHSHAVLEDISGNENALNSAKKQLDKAFGIHQSAAQLSEWCQDNPSD